MDAATLPAVRYFPAENIRNIAIAVSGIFMAVFVIYFRALQPEKLTGAGQEEIMGFVSNLRTTDNLLFPHTNLMEIIKAVTRYGSLRAVLPLLIFTSVSIIIFYAVLQAAKLLYFQGFAKKGIYKKEKALSAEYIFKPSFIFKAQAGKDLRYLIRDTSQWIQVVFLFGLVAIYLFNMYKLPEDLFNLKNIIYFLNIGFVGFVLAAVGARLILPVISTEGRAFWIMRVAPVSMTRYVLYKLINFGLPLVLLGQVVAAASIYILKSDAFINYITMFSTFVITVAIASMGVGFGAYFAKFTIKNPEDLITGVAGLVYMFASSIFIVLVLMVESRVVKDYYMSQMIHAPQYAFHPVKYIPHFAGIIGLMVFAAWGTLTMGIKHLETLEK